MYGKQVGWLWDSLLSKVWYGALFVAQRARLTVGDNMHGNQR